MQQPNFPPPGQQDPITQVDYPRPPPIANQKPNESYDQPGQNVPQQNYQYQQPQMGQSQYYQQPQMGPPTLMPPQQYYQQQQQGQYYQRPVQQMPRQQFPVAAPPMGVQGAYRPMQTLPVQPWSTGLFDCAQDIENTIITLFCPCITFGQIADITDRGMTTCSSAGIMYVLILGCTGLQWIYSWMYRTRMRQQYSLPEDPCHDCLVHFVCEYCALCQEYRELKNRGFNMDLGWIGNMQMQAQMGAAAQCAVAPPVQGMTR
ncbi:hypothetical protein LUZ60_003162 [Juncus effusus]|nr:hypothetical protein LUZ60_003162 [Juncus effusus]